PLKEPPAVLPFPVEVFPLALRRLVEEAAWAYHCPQDMAGLAILAFAGAAIGNSLRLAITDDHVQSACLYAALVSPPGTTKSPLVKALSRPFDLAQHRFLNEWREAMKDW